MRYMRFGLILGMKDWDLKDELENKKVISLNKVQRAKYINKSSILIRVVTVDNF